MVQLRSHLSRLKFKKIPKISKISKFQEITKARSWSLFGPLKLKEADRLMENRFFGPDSNNSMVNQKEVFVT